jgi:N,N'-diacetyllegionaminate synthase
MEDRTSNFQLPTFNFQLNIEHPTSNPSAGSGQAIERRSLFIAGRQISATAPVFVIAEIGVNHDGSLGRALGLVEAARSAGADAVKLQIFRAEALMSASCSLAGYQVQRCGETSAVEMLRGYELSAGEVGKIVGAIREAGMVPLATPFSVADVDVIEGLDLPAVKIASPDIVNRPLLERAARLGRPLLVSTGASTIEEIGRTVGWLDQWGVRFALLHCVSAYPTADRDVNLCWIGEVRERFGVAAGYSDHSTQMMCGALAVAAGACVIEKHLTYDRSAPGPDHAASADPGQFREYVEMVRRAARMRGLPGRRVLAVEEDVRRVSRQSLVLRRRLRAGDVIGEGDLMVQRPGTGIGAAEISLVVGRKLKHGGAAGEVLRWEMLAA